MTSITDGARWSYFNANRLVPVPYTDRLFFLSLSREELTRKFRPCNFSTPVAITVVPWTRCYYGFATERNFVLRFATVFRNGDMKIPRSDDKSVPAELTMTRWTTGTEIGDETSRPGDTGMTRTRQKRGRPTINYLFLAARGSTHRSEDDPRRARELSGQHFEVDRSKWRFESSRRSKFIHQPPPRVRLYTPGKLTGRVRYFPSF